MLAEAAPTRDSDIRQEADMPQHRLGLAHVLLGRIIPQSRRKSGHLVGDVDKAGATGSWPPLEPSRLLNRLLNFTICTMP